MAIKDHAFNTDGRGVIPPPENFIIGSPGKISVANARRMISAFNNSGHSTHSGSASTLWVLIQYCEEEKIPYELRAMPGKGYFIRRTTDVLD